MEENKELFETMPVAKALTKMAIPTIISQLITMIYNLADTYFIGRTNNPYMVAAASLSYVLFFILTALSNLFGVGGGSQISRLLGQKRYEEAKKVCSFSFYGTICVSLLYSLSCLVFMDPLLRLLGATDNTIAYSCQYTLWVIVVGGVPSCLSMTMAHLLRSEGYAKYASYGLSGGGILNMILDPLFMFVIMQPGQEVMGAALATMLSNCVLLIYFALMFLHLKKDTVLYLSPRKMVPEKASIRAVFAVGVPSAIGSLMACLSNTVVNKLSSGYNDFAVAAMGIVKKIDMLPMHVGMGLCQAMVPMVAYNYSTKNYRRMKSFTNAARLSGVVFAGICIVVMEIFASQVIALFINDEETVRYGVDFLRINVLATPLMICNFQMSYTFQAMGKGAESLLLTSCRQGIINIPLLFLMSWLVGLYGIIWTQLLADSITVVISFAFYHHTTKKLKESVGEKALP